MIKKNFSREIQWKNSFYSRDIIFNKAFDKSNGQSSYGNDVCGKRHRFFESNGTVSSTISFLQVPYLFEKIIFKLLCLYNPNQKEKSDNIFACSVVRSDKRLSRYFI
jgi:hypothetical protein